MDGKSAVVLIINRLSLIAYFGLFHDGADGGLCESMTEEIRDIGEKRLD